MKKFKIEAIKVNSFITSIDIKKSKTVNGGLIYTTNLMPLLREKKNTILLPYRNLPTITIVAENCSLPEFI